MLKAKFFVQYRQEYPGFEPTYRLGAVCRGEENKEWASATPVGSLDIKDNDAGLLDALWDRTTREVYVHIAPGGTWRLMVCEFTWGGTSVTFVGEGGQKLSMTVNNSPAVRSIHDSFMEALRKGDPALFSVALSPVDE